MEDYYINIKKAKTNLFYAFDLDNTLIKTKSGKKFPINIDDWEYIIEKDKLFNIFEKIEKAGYNLLIITNQGGIKSKEDLNNFIKKLKNIFGNIDYYIGIKGYYRKPYSGPLEIIKEKIGKEISKESIFVGDAGGRNSDFAQTDYAFAYNNNLIFKTPEIFYSEYNINMKNSEKIKLTRPEIQVYSQNYLNKLINELSKIIKECKNVILINVGSPSSGKSSLSKYIINNLNNDINSKIISMDILKTVEKCKKEILSFKEKEYNLLIIDNTNPTVEKRDYYKNLVKNYTPIIFYYNLTKEQTEYLNMYRCERTKGEICIPEIASRIYYKNLEIPSIKECNYLFEIKKIIHKLEDKYF